MDPNFIWLVDALEFVFFLRENYEFSSKYSFMYLEIFYYPSPFFSLIMLANKHNTPLSP